MSSVNTQFTQLGLSAPMLAVLEEVGYEAPSPIQAASIPALLAGRDLVGQAQTGTGKTAAFALPLLQSLDLSTHKPQILVLTPTRELALQVAESFQTYGRHLKKVRVLPVYGGQGFSLQLQQLGRGVHVVVGTPGRVMDHLRRETLSLSALKTLVLDEADEMLRMGFIDDVEWILEHTPEARQTALFSATMPAPIRKIAKRHLKNPEEVSIQTRAVTVDATAQYYVQIQGGQKLDALARLLEVEDMDAALIFARTKTETVYLAEELEARGYRCAALNGDINQATRERIVGQLKGDRLNIVVATDVAARGLDVDRITHVINYDIPNDVEGYIHRVGRTGRAGRSGKAILFVRPREMQMLRVIERATRKKLEPLSLPSARVLTRRRVERFKQTVVATLKEADNLGFLRTVIEELQQEHELSAEEIAAALAHLVQQKRPLLAEELPGPKVAPGARQEAPDRARRVSPEPSREHSPRQRRDPPEDRPREVRERSGAEDSSGTRDPATGQSSRARASRPETTTPGATHNGKRIHERPLPESVGREEPARPGAQADAASPRHSEKREAKRPGLQMVSYRIEVGRNQGATPKDIVGAIANETGIEGQFIGYIKLYDEYSTVDLPEGMPREIFRHLKKVRVRQHMLKISRLDGSEGDEHDNKPPPRQKRRAQLASSSL